MSQVIIVEKNKDGKIEFTKDELQKILDDAYNRGYSDGRAYDAITYPSNQKWCSTISTVSCDCTL